MKKYEHAYDIPAHIKELFGEREHLTASQVRTLKRWARKLKTETRVAYFSRTAHYRILHDSPVIGASETQFSESSITGPYSREPQPKKAPFEVDSETRKSIETRLFPAGKLPAFIPIAYQRHEARVCLGYLNNDALKHTKESMVNALIDELGHRTPPEKKNDGLTTCSGRIKDAVFELTVREPGFERTHVPLELRILGTQDAAAQVSRALTMTWNGIQNVGISGYGHVIGAKHGLAYGIDLNKLAFTDLKKENLIL